MDLVEIFPACARRWYVVLPLLFVSAWFAFNTFNSVKPIYYTQAVVGVAPPNFQVMYQQPGERVERNGLIDSGGATLIANLVSIGLRDSAVVEKVVAAGGAPDYNAKMYPGPLNSPQLPLIMIEASQATPDRASKTVEAVLAQAEPVFVNVQLLAGVPEDQRAHALITAPPNPPVKASPSRLRSTAAVFLGGAGMSVLMGIVVDLLVNNRRRSRRGDPQPAPREDARGGSLSRETVAAQRQI